MDSGQIYCVYRNQAAAAYSSLYFSFFFLSNFQTKFFITLFSRTVRPRRLKPGTHVDSGQMYRVIRNQAAASYRPFIFLFFFLFSFQTLHFFFTLFWGTVRPWRLKHGTNMDSGQMYCAYRNQAAAAYLFLYFLFFFLSQVSNMKSFRHTFLKNCEALKFETWYTCGQWADVWCIPESGCCCLFVFLFSPIFKHYNFSSHFSHELWGLEGWNFVHTWTVYQNRLLLLIHLFISSFSFLSIFRQTFLRNCKA